MDPQSLCIFWHANQRKGRPFSYSVVPCSALGCCDILSVDVRIYSKHAVLHVAGGSGLILLNSSRLSPENSHYRWPSLTLKSLYSCPLNCHWLVHYCEMVLTGIWHGKHIRKSRIVLTQTSLFCCDHLSFLQQNETRDKQFPGWAEFIGSVLILLSVVQIPLLAFLNRPPNWKRALPAFLRSCCSESLRRRRDNDEVPLEDSDEVQAVAYRQMDDVQA